MLQPASTWATHRDGWAVHEAARETYLLFIFKSVRTLFKNKRTKTTEQTEKKTQQEDQTHLQMAAGQGLLPDISHQHRDSKLCLLNAASCECFKCSWTWFQDDFSYIFFPPRVCESFHSITRERFYWKMTMQRVSEKWVIIIASVSLTYPRYLTLTLSACEGFPLLCIFWY